MFASLKAKLIASGIMVLIIFSALMYVRGLQHTISNLKGDNIILKQDNKSLNDFLQDQTRMQGITTRIEQIGSTEKDHYIIIRDNNEKKISKDVTEGKDKEVGPLLEDFLNNAQ